jgi:hypothetical protein
MTEMVKSSDLLRRSRVYGERARPRVQFPASRRKPLFGGTPNSTRETRMLPRFGFTDKDEHDDEDDDLCLRKFSRSQVSSILP